MLGVLEGFAVIGFIIAAGAVLAHVGVLSGPDQQVLSKVAFWIAGPALIVGVVAQIDLRTMLSGTLLAHASGVVVVALAPLTIWTWALRADVKRTVMATVSTTYINSVNLGIPVAVYALGDAGAVIPMLLIQLVVLQPISLAVLDIASSRGRFRARTFVSPLMNPLVLSTAVGIVLRSTGWQLPNAMAEPLRLVAGIAIPAMLLAYGISLRLGPRPGSEGGLAPTVVATTLKLIALPGVATAVGAGLLGLRGHALLSVAVVAARPTAQNIFIQASAYRCGVVQVRDTIFATTLLSVPVIVVLAAFFG